MPELFATLIDQLARPGLTGQFLWLTIAVFALNLRRLYARGPHDPWVQSAPSLLLSLGVLGTFSGIVVGLGAFESSAIDSSIMQLLGGLSTAFYTSVLSMALALIFRAAVARRVVALTPDDEESARDDDPIERLIHENAMAVKQLRQLNVLAREQAEYLIHITNAVADGDDPKGVVAQLARQREHAEQGVLAVVSALADLKAQQGTATDTRQAQAEALVAVLSRQGDELAGLISGLQEHNQRQLQSRAVADREWRQRLDAMEQLLKAMPDRRDFHALMQGLAARGAPVPQPASTAPPPARSAPSAPGRARAGS